MQGDTLALFVIALDYALTQAIAGREEELGFTLSPRKSKRIPAKHCSTVQSSGTRSETSAYIL